MIVGGRAMTIGGGDLNAVVCEGRRVSSVVGNYGMDDRGKMLMDLCTRNKLCIMNS